MPSCGPVAGEAAALAQAIGATPQALADLGRFKVLLEEGNGRMNLVGPSALGEFWTRHALDSAQLLQIEPEARTWADLGSGAGFPGIVLAILVKNLCGAKIHLVESMTKRARFLAEVVEELDLPATVHPVRAEALNPPRDLDVVTARACAPLSRLLQYAFPYIASGAVGLFLKGRDVEQEIDDARRSWRFTAELRPSLSDASGRVLRIERLARV